MNKIPKSFEVGGQLIEIKKVPYCLDNKLGLCSISEGKIFIADKFTCGREAVCSETSKLNTFYHELTHSILDTMGETELSENEVFVCSFSALLTEVMKTMKY